MPKLTVRWIVWRLAELNKILNKYLFILRICITQPKPIQYYWAFLTIVIEQSSESAKSPTELLINNWTSLKSMQTVIMLVIWEIVKGLKQTRVFWVWKFNLEKEWTRSYIVAIMSLVSYQILTQIALLQKTWYWFKKSQYWIWLPRQSCIRETINDPKDY